MFGAHGGLGRIRRRIEEGKPPTPKQRERILYALAMLYAGPYAEKMLTGRFDRRGATDDVGNIKRYGGWLEDRNEAMAASGALAWTMLEEHWPAVQAVAEALIAEPERALSMARVRAIGALA